jgi:PncC family amidohydrolase
MTERLTDLARRIATAAIERGVKIVLAESCTAGLAAHALSRIPGASQWLCGSAVVYRDETKTAWLGLAPAALADPTIGPVSRQTAAAMCSGVLQLTPEADLAISVTGHLGPNAPPALDGLVYIGSQWRHGGAPIVSEHHFPATIAQHSRDKSARDYRQSAAAETALTRLLIAVGNNNS